MVRVIEPKEIMRYFFLTNDDILDHKFIPNGRGFFETMEFRTEYVINSLGLRDREFPLQKPPKTVRILMIGDSFTEGNGVNIEQTFSKRMEQMLDSSSLPYRTEVINAGVGSYSPLPEYLYLKNGGLQLHPDLVILNFDLSDVYDDIQYTNRAKFDERGVPVAIVPQKEIPSNSRMVRMMVGIKDFFKEHTRLYNFIRIRLDRFLSPPPTEGVVNGDVRSDKYALLKEEYASRGPEEWALSEKYLLMIRDTLSAHGIDFMISMYPYGLQLSPREWNSGRKFWGFKQDTVYSTNAQKILESFCASKNIPSINLTGEFEERAKTMFPLYFDYDGHWRPEGQEIAAQGMYRKVRPFLESRGYHP